MERDFYSTAVVTFQGDGSLSEWWYFSKLEQAQNSRIIGVREASTVSNSAAGEPKMTYFGLSEGHPPRVGGCFCGLV